MTAPTPNDADRPLPPYADETRDSELFQEAYVGACRAGSRLMVFMSALGTCPNDPHPALAAPGELAIEIAKVEANFSEYARLTGASVAKPNAN